MTETPEGEADIGRSSRLLRVVDLTLSFGGLVALSGVTFSVDTGESVGLIGPNGAGKTSLLNCMTGFYRAQHGDVRVDDDSIVASRAAVIARRGISRTFQHAGDISGIGARDVMLLGCDALLPSGVLQWGLPWPGLAHAERAAVEWVETLADELGISNVVTSNTPFELLPYGTRKLVDIGRALASSPRLILLDEPAAGLSSDEKTQMVEVIARFHERRTISQVIVDHDVDFVSALSDRLVVLDSGRLIADGDVRSVMSDPAVIASYIGVAAEADDGKTER